MAKCIFRLDERSVKNGLCQVRMRISHSGTNAWVGTGVWVSPECFSNNNMYEPVGRSVDSAQKNARLMEMLMLFKHTVADMERDDAHAFACAHANDIRKRMGVCVRDKGSVVRGASAAKMTKEEVRGKDFMELLNQYGLSRPNANTRKHYQYVWEVLYRYCKDKGRTGISVADIDYALLCDIKRWIFATGKGEATRYKVESYMRTVYHEAERLKLVDRNDSPYFDYKIAPVPVGDIDVLDVEVLRRMLALNLDKHIGMARARDILMASFYLCGANLIDLYHISRPVAGEAVFVRHKVEHRTKRALHIRLEPELVDIVGRHRGSKTMFDFCEHQPYNNYQYKLNTLCRKLSEAVGSKVNMELIRRTWATIASELEVPDRVIDKSMGHVDSSVKDKYYERYDWSRTAMYNRKVIDFVWQGVVPNSIALC